MAYNNGFPVAYPYYTPTVQPNTPTVQPNTPTNQMNAPTNGIIWVQGEAGAKSYLVAPNSTVQLWDSESQKIYLKSADASGMPSMRVLEYTITDNPLAETRKDYVTKTELDELKEQIEELRAKLKKKE